VRAEVCRAFFKRGIQIFAFANDNQAGLDITSVGLFLKVFEQNKIDVDFHRRLA
jgi:hypothetical protein